MSETMLGQQDPDSNIDDDEPTEQEILEYARFLGIDDPEFLWIAEEGV